MEELQGAKNQGYLFNTGSSSNLGDCKNKIQTTFQAAGVWEYVFFPPPALPLVGPLPELIMAQPEPTHLDMVDNASVVTRYNSVAKIIAISG